MPPNEINDQNASILFSSAKFASQGASSSQFYITTFTIGSNVASEEPNFVTKTSENENSKKLNHERKKREML